MSIKLIFLIFFLYKFEINWCDHKDYNYCTPIQNQYLPFSCENGDYVMAAISTISDNLNIQNKGTFPEVVLSPQLLICKIFSSKNVDVCEQNKKQIDLKITDVLDIIKNDGLEDDTCFLYKGNTKICKQNKGDAVENFCESNVHIENKLPKKFTTYKIKGYKPIDIKEVQNILKKGPVLCKFYLPKTFMTPNTDFNGDFSKNGVEKFLSIVGENKNTYLVKGSFGEQFSNYGFANIKKENVIKGSCYEIELNEKNKNKIFLHYPNKTKKEVKSTEYEKNNVEYIDEVNYFKFYKDKNGKKIEKNILTPIKSQGNTGNCWAFSTATTIQDRIMVKKYVDRANGNKNNLEKIVLSEQSLVNFFNGGSGVGGGEVSLAFSRLSLKNWDKKNGINPLLISRKTCTNFDEKDPENFRKDLSQLCKNKDGKPYDFTNNNKLNYLGFKLKGFKFVRGEKEMKKALEDGPISCSLNAGALRKYMVKNEPKTPEKEKKVFENLVKRINVDHAVQIVGYGRVKGGGQDGLDYWIMRNSWGLGWNDNGLVKLQRRRNNFGIEAECLYPEIDYEKKN